MQNTIGVNFTIDSSSRICEGEEGIIMETTSGDYGYRPLSIRNSFGLCLEEERIPTTAVPHFRMFQSSLCRFARSIIE